MWGGLDIKEEGCGNSRARRANHLDPLLVRRVVILLELCEGSLRRATDRRESEGGGWEEGSERERREAAAHGGYTDTARIQRVRGP